MDVGSLIDAGLGFGQSKLAYRRQKKLQQRQFDFQERMSSTAYQRAVQDMQRAGLSKTLMYSTGTHQSSTPSGAGGSAPGTPPTKFGEGKGRNLIERMQRYQIGLMSDQSYAARWQGSKTGRETKILEETEPYTVQTARQQAIVAEQNAKMAVNARARDDAMMTPYEHEIVGKILGTAKAVKDAVPNIGVGAIVGGRGPGKRLLPKRAPKAPKAQPSHVNSRASKYKSKGNKLTPKQYKSGKNSYKYDQKQWDSYKSRQKDWYLDADGTWKKRK